MQSSETKEKKNVMVSENKPNSVNSTEPPLPVAVLSTADFNASVWTNKQHLAVGLAEHTSVIYIESLGLREPKLNLVDLKRAAAKLGGLVIKRIRHQTRTSKVASAPPNLKILTPRLIPFHRIRVVRWINKRILARTIIPKVTSEGDFILWTFSPMTYGIEDHSASVVYHSVDLLHEIPGVPKKTLLDAERNLVQSADVAIASSGGVAKHLRKMGVKRPLIWENVASVELFSSAGTKRTERAIFAGNMTPTKVDVSLLFSIAEAGIPLALAGPLSIDGIDSNREFQALLDTPGVTYIGNLDLQSLATEVANSTVGLIPYHINPYTDGVFPMKVYEYLAAGLEVVSTRLPSLLEDEIYGLRILSPTEFTAGVVDAFNKFDEASAERRRQSAEPFSWKNRIADAARLVNQLSGEKAQNNEG